jgi:hypothetical protein
MKLNSKDPEIFKYQMNYVNPDIAVKIPNVLEPFVWPQAGITGDSKGRNGK